MSPDLHIYTVVYHGFASREITAENPRQALDFFNGFKIGQAIAVVVAPAYNVIVEQPKLGL